MSKQHLEQRALGKREGGQGRFLRAEHRGRAGIHQAEVPGGLSGSERREAGPRAFNQRGKSEPEAGRGAERRSQDPVKAVHER